MGEARAILATGSQLVSRQFKIRDYGTLEFRWEKFNVTTHANFQHYNDAIDTPSATITVDETDVFLT